ncbi:hypothetical protein K491DRAFT_685715 [Lophiostoma macrostomum CBS 122681]|uniref:Uncharacterized protein n=1 Tax=Lophiostoma macrostomum CBS 122681 TaxID=1314788 RepID=A0A6A6SHF8_9PLEO|nr:hypothetical protein K491DRAFT_685715 [Lophiostoma macrostomum CBS 122681]
MHTNRHSLSSRTHTRIGPLCHYYTPDQFITYFNNTNPSYRLLEAVEPQDSSRSCLAGQPERRDAARELQRPASVPRRTPIARRDPSQDSPKAWSAPGTGYCSPYSQPVIISVDIVCVADKTQEGTDYRWGSRRGPRRTQFDPPSSLHRMPPFHQPRDSHAVVSTTSRNRITLHQRYRVDARTEELDEQNKPRSQNLRGGRAHKCRIDVEVVVAKISNDPDACQQPRKCSISPSTPQRPRRCPLVNVRMPSASEPDMLCSLRRKDSKYKRLYRSVTFTLRLT